MVNTVTVTEEITVQKETIVQLLRLADWATICIEAWHDYSPDAVSGIDGHLPQFKETIARLCTEMNIDAPQF